MFILKYHTQYTIMLDLVQCLVRTGYYYARFLAIFNFEIDLRTGRARSTRRTTIYAAIVHVLTISILPMLSVNEVMHSFVSRAGLLHEYIFLAMLGGRILCVYVTVFIRWWQRPRVIRLVNDFVRLTKQKPQVIRMWRRGVISKFVSICLTEGLQMVIGMIVIRNTLTLRMTISVLIMTGVTALINVMITHFYFALLNVHGHYILLNEELRGLLSEIRSLESEHRKGVLTIKYCDIADRLEIIARTQFLLQSLVKRTTSLFGLQTLIMSISAYMAAVAIIYFAFSELPGTRISLSWSNWKLTALLFVQFVFYFADLHISVNIVYYLLVAHGKMVKLLSQNTLFAPGLDKRLDSVFENFQLQLASNPLKVSILDLYDVEKSKAVSMASSIVTSSLVLVQYDLQNS